MRHSDFAFANDVRAAVELRTPRTARMLLVTTIAMIVIGLIWANFAILEEVTRGNGRVVPSRLTQFVQSLEGGLVNEILVREGEIVQHDQPLMRISDVKFASELGEVRERRAAMAARVARLEAEAQGRSTVTFPEELAPEHTAPELSVFEARARRLAQDLDVMRQQEIRLTETLAILSKELNITRNLFKQKVVPEIEMLRLERQASELRGQLAETKAKLEHATAAFRSQSEEDLAKSRGDLAVLDETIKSAQDRVRRTELRAPVYGIVNRINVTTVGAVVQPAANVMEIVPLDDTLLVEGRIRPQDIGFIRPNQDAVVKLTAYDPSVYGSLKGKVERISADAIVDEKERQQEKGETFYRVMIRTEKNYLGTPEKQLPIIPGMVTTVEILTGEKSVLDYLLKPARMLRESALRER
jgi:adhesin transport system membrane fusion protein